MSASEGEQMYVDRIALVAVSVAVEYHHRHAPYSSTCEDTMSSEQHRLGSVNQHRVTETNE